MSGGGPPPLVVNVRCPLVAYRQVAGWATLAVVSADFADPAGVAGSILEDQL